MKTTLIFPALLLFFACETSSVGDDPNTIIPDNSQSDNSSPKGKITHVGNIKMDEGPHDLLIEGNKLYTVRDHKIIQFNLQNPAIPVQLAQYTLPNASFKFGKLYAVDNKLFVACQSDGLLYEFDSSLSLSKKHELSIASFKPNVVLKDVQGKLWVGGSNGSKGIIAKYGISNTGVLQLEAHYIMAGNDSNMESILEYNDYIIASIPKGDLLSFKKSDASLVTNVSFVNEGGHEKWGHTIIRNGNMVYWANWGAGFAAVDITNPAAMKVNKILTNSLFKSQFKEAEGTNVYDVVYNAKYDLLCIANGWSGVVLVKSATPDLVYDFIDPQYFQNRCIETLGDYVYTGNISGGVSGDLKGIKIFKLKN